MGATNQTSRPLALVPKPSPNFPTVEEKATIWLAAHDRLVKSAHALDRSLLMCQVERSLVDFNAPVVREFRAAVMEVKDLEAAYRSQQ